MAKAHDLVIHKSLISWITSKNRWLQAMLVVTAIIAVLANVLPLEMQKRIVNDAINLRKFDLLVIYCGIYLVAFLSAQEKLYDPWKELIQFYQAYQTASVTYSRTMEYFDVEPEHTLMPDDNRNPYELKGDIEVSDLSFVTDDDTRLLSEINFGLKHGEHMALVGFSGSGKSTLAQCIVQLYKYSGGKILIDQKKVSQLSKKDIIHSIGFVSQTPFIFEGSIEENLLYAVTAKAEQEQADAQPKMPGLDDRILALQQTGLFTDVLHFGLNAVLDKDKHKDIIRQILNVRRTFRQDFAKDLAEFIEFYDPDNYLHHASVAENIIFGDPQDTSFNPHNLPQNEIFIEFLAEAKLREPLLNLGVAFIEELIKLSEHRSSDKKYWHLISPTLRKLTITKGYYTKLKGKGFKKSPAKSATKSYN